MEYGAEKVQCPFYISETKNTIRCEGIVSDTCTNNFGTAKTKKKHYNEKCCMQYRNCKIYRSLDLLY